MIIGQDKFTTIEFLFAPSLEKPGHAVQIAIFPVQVQADIFFRLSDGSFTADFRVVTKKLRNLGTSLVGKL